ncbi:UDP-N-acetyl-D-mannosamine dehydrogenase [ANME-1 cluster archaeon GoMg3.2]|nr:UDP-N-acetyl-D-mannosamine dehydrogenase [ANME-1 cluster archaeon GoMg3.2]
MPTPVTKSKEPDLSYVKSAAETVGKNLKKGATVVLESTVYPSVTEEVVAPINFRTGIKDELRSGFQNWLLARKDKSR